MSERLLIDGCTSDLRLRRACTWWTRLIGFWPAPQHHAVEAIEFIGCRAIHTFAMRADLDVVFVDDKGCVLRVVRQLPPWRAALEYRAHAVFEFRAGIAAELGIKPGTVLRAATPPQDSSSPPGNLHARERGSAMLEFVLAVTLVLLPLISGILEFAQLAVSRQMLAQATVDAARSAAIHVMDAGGKVDSATESLAIRLSLARGLLPLLGGRALDAGDLAQVTLETMRPDRLQISIERDLLDTVDVVVDRLEITYCRELFFAPASHILPALMRSWTFAPFDRLCLESGRVPLRVSAPATRSRYP